MFKKLASKKKSISALLSLTLLATGLAACGSGSSNTDAGGSGNTSVQPGASTAERKMTDGLGHVVTVPAKPQKIIASYLEDYLVALGVKPAAQWSVANGIQVYLQQTLEGVPTIPYDLPFEAVLSFQPDLLLIGSNGTVEGDKYDRYAKIAPTFVLGDDILKDWRKTLLKIGEVLNKSDEAKKALDQYERKAAEAKAQIQSKLPDKSVAAIWLVKNSFFVVSDKLSSGAVLYNDLGFKVPSVVKEASVSGTANWNPISLEKLAGLDADHLILINSDKDTGSAALNDPIWKTIKAVKTGNVYEYPRTASWLYYGPIASSQMIDHVLKDIVNK